MWDRAPQFGGGEPPLNLLTHVEVILDILERRIVGQVLEELAYFVLGSLQFDLPNFTLPRLKATGQSVCPAWRCPVGRLVVSTPPDAAVHLRRTERPQGARPGVR